MRGEIRDLAGRADVTPNTITAALTKLEDEKQKLELDLMAKAMETDSGRRKLARLLAQSHPKEYQAMV